MWWIPQFDLTSYSNIYISWTKELMKVTSKKFKCTVPELEYLICPVTDMSVVLCTTHSSRLDIYSCDNMAVRSSRYQLLQVRSILDKVHQASMLPKSDNIVQITFFYSRSSLKLYSPKSPGTMGHKMCPFVLQRDLCTTVNTTCRRKPPNVKWTEQY